MRSQDNQSIRIYTTTIPTEHRIPTLLSDPQYRNAMITQMNGYNQPPHVSYFLGEKDSHTIVKESRLTAEKLTDTELKGPSKDSASQDDVDDLLASLGL